MGTEKAGFYGKVGVAGCKCHEGKFMVAVYLLNPLEQEEIFLGSVFFNTESEAMMKMVEVVKTRAQQYLEEIGIDADSIIETEQVVGDGADKMVSNFMREQNPNLH